MNHSGYHQKPAKKKSGSNYKTIGIVILVLVIIAAALFIFKSCSGDSKTLANDPQNTGIVYDSGAVEGGWDEADVDKIIEGLNEKVEEGMINISMNTSPNFANGTSAGNLMIVNEAVNRYPQVVEITRNDTNEVIYKSGAIPVGSKIRTPSSRLTLTPVLTNAPPCSTTSMWRPATISAALALSSTSRFLSNPKIYGNTAQRKKMQ